MNQYLLLIKESAAKTISNRISKVGIRLIMQTGWFLFFCALGTSLLVSMVSEPLKTDDG